MPTTTVEINSDCYQVVNTPGVAITTLDGRNTGSNVNFMTFTYSELQMRRKAEVLKYKPNQIFSKKKVYSNAVNSGGYYSQTQIQNYLNNKTADCSGTIGSSTCAGVVGSYTTLFYNPEIPYYPSL